MVLVFLVALVMEKENIVRINLDGWEMTKGSFYNKEHDITIHRTWDYHSKKAYWICKHPGFKTEDFPTVFEAVLKVQRRFDAKHSNNGS